MTHLKKSIALFLITPVIVLGLLFIMLRYLIFMLINPIRGFEVGLGVDITSNVAANGKEGQSISSRAAFAAADGKEWGCILCRVLNWINPGHCARAMIDPWQNMVG